MFKHTLAIAITIALLGLGPAAAGSKTHHHHMKKQRMMSSSSSSMMHRSSSSMHQMRCRDKKTGRYMKCAG